MDFSHSPSENEMPIFTRPFTIYEAIKYSSLREYLIKTIRRADPPKPNTDCLCWLGKTKDPLENYEICIISSYHHLPLGFLFLFNSEKKEEVVYLTSCGVQI